MIYLDIVGRCGNQMFQYAFAKKIAMLNDDEISIDFYHVYKEAKERKDVTFKNDLDAFQASKQFEIIESGRNKIYEYGSKKQIIVFKIYTKIKRLLQKFCNDKRIANKLLYKIMSHYGIYWYYAPTKLKPCKEKNKFLWGYFEDPQYFNDIFEQIFEDFTPLSEVCEKNREMYETIQNSESVCVSFRKWKDNEPVDDDRFVCNKIYYENALKVIFNKVSNARLVIFSNDIEWVKQEFELPDNSIYETGEDSVYEKLRLMYSCKHFVLSNSTFAWWAQYLGRDEQKIVIAPRCWFRNEKKQNPLLQYNFVKVRNK